MLDLINLFSFVRVIHNNFKEEHGIAEGDVVFVASAKAFPISEEDPYTQRIKLFVQKTKDDKIQDEDGFYLIDPISVQNIDPEEHKIFVNVNGLHPDAAAD